VAFQREPNPTSRLAPLTFATDERETMKQTVGKRRTRFLTALLDALPTSRV
jgi:hypothetical protein